MLNRHLRHSRALQLLLTGVVAIGAISCTEEIEGPTPVILEAEGELPLTPGL